MISKKYSTFLFLVGVLGLAIFLNHILGFTPHDYFYIQNPDIDKYVGVNVVSMWADLSFFTYHTLIFFSIWCILQFICRICNLNNFYNFLFRSDVITFITINYIITASFYTFFELSSGTPTFGLYANTPNAYHSFVTNIIVHYIIFIISVINYIKIKVTHKHSKLSHLLISIYLLLYFIIVKLTGLYSYQIIWYPYPIFDSESLVSMLGLTTTPVVSTLLLIIVNIFIYVFYMFLYKILLLKKEKMSKD